MSIEDRELSIAIFQNPRPKTWTLDSFSCYHKTMKPEAERIRIRYLYRRMILNGELNISHGTAKRMVGPDCAYHLYGRHTQVKPKAQRPKPKGK